MYRKSVDVLCANNTVSEREKKGEENHKKRVSNNLMK